MAVEAGGERYIATYAQTFADVKPGELIVYQDAYRTLALAINRGDAAGTLGARRGRRGAAAAGMIGTPRVHHRLTDSTNERAKELADAGAPHGTLVTADEQTAGRGRQGRAWTAPPGSAVLMSLVLRELDERHRCCRWRRRWRCARRCRSTRHDQVAERRLDRAAARWPASCRGAASGGLGGAGHRAERDDGVVPAGAGRDSQPRCAWRVTTRLRRTSSPALLRRSRSAGSALRPTRCWRPGALGMH